MRLSQKALDKISTVRIRRKIAEALDVTDQAVWKWIKRNDDNLTKAAAMKVIREETKLADEEILVVSTV